MKIYILKAFPNAHKWYPDSWVIGYFTSKAKLQKAIAHHWETLGGYNRQDFNRAFYNRYYVGDECSYPDMYLECGEIEVATANEYDREE